MSAPLKGQIMIGAGVAQLLLAGSPFTIIRRVALIIINTLKRQSIRSFAHILDKYREVIPFGADGNTSSSIITPSLVGRIVTPSPHRPPNLVNFISPSTVSFLHMSTIHHCLNVEYI